MKWVSRIKNRKSNFDVMPPDGKGVQLIRCIYY
jgi:hypothetical protein